MTSGDKKRQEPTTPSRPTVVLMLATIADTTWRMFIPTVGLAYLGWLADKQWGTKPWLLAVGVVIGAIISAALVRRQLQFTKKS